VVNHVGEGQARHLSDFCAGGVDGAELGHGFEDGDGGVVDFTAEGEAEGVEAGGSI